TSKSACGSSRADLLAPLPATLQRPVCALGAYASHRRADYERQGPAAVDPSQGGRAVRRLGADLARLDPGGQGADPPPTDRHPDVLSARRHPGAPRDRALAARGQVQAAREAPVSLPGPGAEPGPFSCAE